MRRLILVPALAAAVLTAATAVAGCATMRVSSHEWPGAESGRYRTFAWAAQERLEPTVGDAVAKIVARLPRGEGR